MKEHAQLKAATDVFLKAIHDGNSFLVESLLEALTRKIDMSDITDSNGCNALHLAAIKGHLNFAKMVTTKFPGLIDSKTTDGSSPIVLAMLNEHDELVHYFLSQNADPIITNAKGENCFTLAANKPEGHSVLIRVQEYRDLLNKNFVKAVREEHYELIEEWLKKGADIETPMSRTIEPKCISSALFHASSVGNAKLAELLISYHANLNVIGAKNGFTPLHAAVYFSHPEIVSLLLKSGAQISLDQLSETPLDIAKKRTDKSIIDLFGETFPANTAVNLNSNSIRQAEFMPKVTGDCNRFMPAPSKTSSPEVNTIAKVSLQTIREKISSLSKHFVKIEEYGTSLINSFNARCTAPEHIEMKIDLSDFNKPLTALLDALKILRETFIDSNDVVEITNTIQMNYKLEMELGKIVYDLDSIEQSVKENIIVSLEYRSEYQNVLKETRDMTTKAKKLEKVITKIHHHELELINEENPIIEPSI